MSRAGGFRPRPWAAVVSLVAVVATTTAVVFAARQTGDDGDVGNGRGGSSGKVAAGCDVEPELLRRVRRGYRPYRSGDVLAIERLPHQFGTRHSSPHPYTQDVPLLLYGPGYIRSGLRPTRPVTLADLAPTFAHLMGFDDFPDRAGELRAEALLPEAKRNGRPKLLVTVVWDGGGDNVLERWSESWPRLQALSRRGVWYENATVGSSPSITPAVHATIGTGAYPTEHGLPDIKMRAGGEIVDAWQGGSSRYLETATLGDLWDAANGNVPLVGALARDYRHLGMLGHGSARRGGDSDVAVLDSFDGVYFRDRVRRFRVPQYLKGPADLSDEVTRLDAADGEIDGAWLGNEIVSHDPHVRYTPAWPSYQTDTIGELLGREGFGSDDVPDLFYTNYKGIDLAGHQWNMLDEEVRDVLEAHDAEIPRLIEVLDDLVGPRSYVLALTADHGMAPRPEAQGGWSISTSELSADIEREFNPRGDERPFIMSNRSYQIMFDRGLVRDLGVSYRDLAAFLRQYRLRDNVTDGSREIFERRFRDRADERLYLIALTPRELGRTLRRCGP